jgi:thiamine-phosphate pyrophosphorylase
MKKALHHLQCYLVLDADQCGQEKKMLAITKATLLSGITMIQLRMKNWPKKRCIKMAKAMKTLLNNTTIPLIINDHVDVAIEADADGIHIGQQDLPPEQARLLIGQDKWLGLSISNSAELKSAPKHLVDYLGVGPVFCTASKQDATCPIGIKGLTEMVNLAKPVPVVAIGGIGIENIKDLLPTHIAGVAIISAICNQVNPSQAAYELAKTLKGKINDF